MQTRSLGGHGRTALLAAGGLCLVSALTPLPADAADKALAAQLKQLHLRMQQLEQRNQALEQ